MARILAVDDIPDNLYVLERLLRAHGHTVRTARDGIAALDSARAEPPDLILLDLMMPGMDGFAVLERLKGIPKLADVPVIILTAADHESERTARALALGAHDYIAKPVDNVELLARVAAALRLRAAQVSLQQHRDELTEALIAVEEARRRAEVLTALAQERADQIEAVIASMAEGVYICDAEGNMLQINRRGRALLGLDGNRIDEAISRGAALDILRRPADGEEGHTESPLTRVLRGETIQGLELTLRDAEHDRVTTLLLTGAPLYDAKQALTGAVLVANDITGLKELDRAKDDFMAMVAHELKTPLTGLKGYAQLLARRLSKQEGRESEMASVRAIEGQVSRMVTLINDLLDASRAQVGHLVIEVRPTDVAMLAHHVAESLQSSTERHQISVDTPESLIWPVDPGRIEQVLGNLVSNAIRYSSEGPINVRIAREGDTLRIGVRDHGIGIAAETLERIFNRFEQGGTPHGQGLGLGLYISRAIVQAHGGQIWAESEGKGRGATFCVSLPWSDAAPQ